jgi:hypothetical protein
VSVQVFFVIGLAENYASTCKASEPLFTVPATALINVETLAMNYPDHGSPTATQLISLHLFLFRPEDEHDSADPLFGPFISIFPRMQEFDSHPLTWLVRRATNTGSPSQSALLDLLPPHVSSSLVALKDRFFEDWNAVLRYMVIQTQLLMPT